MEQATINVKGVDFEVFYSLTSDKDPYGTGDSPTQYYLDVHAIAIEPIPESVDLKDHLSDWVIEYIESKIISLEANQYV